MRPKPNLLLTLTILATALAVEVWTDQRSAEVLSRPLDSISRDIDGWRSKSDQKLQDVIVATLDATGYLSRTYRKGSTDLDMFAAFYARQKAGESMHSPKYCLPGGGWEFRDFRTVTVSTPNGPARINRSIIQKPGSRALMLYWYQSRTRVVASEYQSKFFLVWDSLFHSNPGGSIVRIILPDAPHAEQDGIAFATRLLVEVQKCLKSSEPGERSLGLSASLQ